MSGRRQLRRTAIDILYQADVLGESPSDVIDSWEAAGREIAPFTAKLVSGTSQREPEIDLLLERHSDEWKVERMTSVDRTILRLGVFELLSAEVPPSVAISEAVEAAAELSSEEAKGFVNGLLGRIAEELVSK